MSESEEVTIMKKAQECVEYILMCVMAERKAIFKRADLHKSILKDHVKLSKQVLKQTQELLDESFGLDLIDMDGEDVCERYGVRSQFDFDDALFRKDTDYVGVGGRLATADDADANDHTFVEQMRYGMLMLALSLIFMNENEMDANLFWDSLKRLDINKDEKKHKYLGDVSKFFCTELVRDGYLEYEQMRGVEPIQHKFKWGQRAKLEVPKMNVLRFVCDMYGGSEVCKPQDWLAQYKDACKSDLFNEEQQDAAALPNQQVANMSIDDDEHNENEPPAAAAATQRATRGSQRRQ